MKTKITPSSPDTKTKLLDAALLLIRSQGYAATSVDDICAHAHVTKGGFFHHFKSKEQLALDAAAYFGTFAARLFQHASYHAHAQPLDRLLSYIDVRIEILRGDLPHYTCLLGTMLQETYATHPAIRQACDQFITEHSEAVAQDVQACKTLYAPKSPWTAKSIAFHIQAVIQGAFILAKAKQGPKIAVDSLTHLRRYLEMLFDHPAKTTSTKPKTTTKTKSPPTASARAKPAAITRQP